MESKVVLPEHTPVVQTGKDPSPPPSTAPLSQFNGDAGDLEVGDVRHSRSPKRHHKKHVVLVPNPTGRYVFLGIFALLALSVIVGFVGLAAVISSSWAGIVSLVLIIIGSVYVSCVSTTPSLFLHRRINFAVLCGLAVVSIVFQVICGGEPPALYHAGNIAGASLLLVSGVILLLPEHMPVTTNLHPFIHTTKMKTRSGSKSSSGSQSPKSTASSGKDKRTVTKTMTLYEDWPDPIPFPARAIYTFNTTSPSELAFVKGDPLTVVDCRGNWWQARHNGTGQSGFIPSNFVQVIPKARVVRRYLAASEDEVSVQEGQVVELMEHHEFASLVRTVEGAIGSVPTACLEPVPDTALEKSKL